jgi:hypothetical protein
MLMEERGTPARILNLMIWWRWVGTFTTRLVYTTRLKSAYWLFSRQIKLQIYNLNKEYYGLTGRDAL